MTLKFPFKFFVMKYNFIERFETFRIRKNFICQKKNWVVNFKFITFKMKVVPRNKICVFLYGMKTSYSSILDDLTIRE